MFFKSCDQDIHHQNLVSHLWNVDDHFWVDHAGKNNSGSILDEARESEEKRSSGSLAVSSSGLVDQCNVWSESVPLTVLVVFPSESQAMKRSCLFQHVPMEHVVA